MRRRRTLAWLLAIVVAHAVVSAVHGQAHSGAAVPLSPAANAFVFVVILAGPIVSLAVMWWNTRNGSWLLTATLGASFVFGVVNHFVLVSPDHVGHVAQEWRFVFTTTAVLLAVTEAAGSLLALRAATERTVS